MSARVRCSRVSLSRYRRPATTGYQPGDYYENSTKIWRNGSAKTQPAQKHHNDDNQTDDINDAVHDPSGGHSRRFCFATDVPSAWF